jgi:hypothetical protein
MVMFRKRLNAILKINRKNLTSVGEEERGKEVSKASRIALSALFVLIAFEQIRRSGSNLILSMDQFLEKYPRFAGIEDRSLLAFRNFMAVSLTLEVAKNNKAFHMEICARLSEGFAAKYITGSGQSSATSRRVAIYEREGDVTPEGSRKIKREQDDGYSSESTSATKRSRSESLSDCYLSEQEDEVHALAHVFDEHSPYTPEEPSMLQVTGDLQEFLESSRSSPVTVSEAALDVADFELEDFNDIDEQVLFSIINADSKL